MPDRDGSTNDAQLSRDAANEVSTNNLVIAP
jgi:hypothetical protein